MRDKREKRLGNLNGFTGGNFAGNVYDDRCLSPALNTMGGGGRQPMIIVAMRGRNPQDPSDIMGCKLLGGVGPKNSNGGTQYYQQDRVYSSEGVAMCLPANIPGGSYRYMVEEKEIVKVRQATKKGYVDICKIETRYRIRKLTPRECWRLMGFSDEDFEKAEAVNSNTQLYKQAGNSIVKDVLMAIFGEMLREDE